VLPGRCVREKNVLLAGLLLAQCAHTVLCSDSDSEWSLRLLIEWFKFVLITPIGMAAMILHSITLRSDRGLDHSFYK
jgi:hypothetical protein